MAIKITIIKSGEEIPLVLEEDFKSSFQHKNPLFELDRIPGAYSLGLKVPIDGNQDTLNYSHSVQIRDGGALFDARFYHNNRLLHVGVFFLEKSITKPNGSFYDGTFIIDGYGTLVQGKTIRDVVTDQIDLGSTPEDIADEAKTITFSLYPDSVMCFPTFKNESFYGNIENYNPTVFNLFDQTSEEFPYNEDGTTQYSLVPMVYAMHVLRSCFEYFGYTVSGPAFDDASLRLIIVVGQHAIDQISNKGIGVVGTVSDQVLTDPSLISWQEELENLTGTTITTPSNFPLPLTTGYNQYLVQGTIVIASAFTGSFSLILNPSGDNVFTYAGSGNETVEFEAVVTMDPGTDSPVGVIFNSTGSSITLGAGSTFSIIPVDDDLLDWNYWKGQFDLKDCLPNTGIQDFIKEMRKIANLGIFIDSIGKSVYVIGANDAGEFIGDPGFNLGKYYTKELKEPNTYKIGWSNEELDVDESISVGDFDTPGDFPIARPGIIAWANNTNNWYSAKLNEETSTYFWERIGPRLSGYSYGEGTVKNIKMSSPLPVVDVFSDGTDDLVGMILDNTGSSNYEAQGKRDWSLQFSLYLGFRNGSTGPFPLSSPYPYDYEGNTVTELSLKVEDENYGLWEKRWRKFIEIIDVSSSIEFECLIVGADIESSMQKVMRQFGQKYLIEQVDIQHSNNIRESVGKITLRKINAVI